MAAFQTLRTWQQRLGAASGTTSSNGHAAAPSRANGHAAVAAQPDEFGADLTVHTCRLADDPDAAVLAMCGVPPGSPTGADRCGLLQCCAAWQSHIFSSSILKHNADRSVTPCARALHGALSSSNSTTLEDSRPEAYAAWNVVVCLSAAREAEGQQPSVTSIRGMFADATRPTASYRPDEDDDEEDGYGPKRAKSQVRGFVMPLFSH